MRIWGFANQASYVRKEVPIMTPIVDSGQPVDYSSTTTPTSYACTKCGKTGVKLWREYQTF